MGLRGWVRVGLAAVAGFGAGVASVVVLVAGGSWLPAMRRVGDWHCYNDPCAMSPWSQVWPALYLFAPPVVFAVVFGVFARAPRRAGGWVRFGGGVVVGYWVVLLAGSWVAVWVGWP